MYNPTYNPSAAGNATGVANAPLHPTGGATLVDVLDQVRSITDQARAVSDRLGY